MRKKNNSKKSKKNNGIVDMSSRKKMDIIYEHEYTDEDINSLLLELQKQMKQMEVIQQRYYSLNAYIDRIQERTFSNILEAKLLSIISKVLSSIHLENEK